MIIEIADYLGTTSGYLLNGEKRCLLSKDEEEMLMLLSMINNPTLRMVALEQVRVLTNVEL